MWLVYQTESMLDPIIEQLCDTFLNHCEREKKHTMMESQGGTAYWFKVSKDSHMDRTGLFIRVEGVFGSSTYRFRSTKTGFSFAADNCYDIEGLFFDFMNIMNYYRTTHGQEAFDPGYLFNLAEEASPPITDRNYIAFSEDYIAPMIEVLNRHFRGAGTRQVSGKFAYTIYSEGAARLYPPVLTDYIPLAQKYLTTFKSLYLIDDVMLLGVRIAGRQHVYFIANGTSLFYNGDDDSREVLEREYKRMTNSLSKFGHNNAHVSEMNPVSVRQYDSDKYAIYSSPY